MYHHYRPEVTSPLSERNGQTEKKSWHLPLSENDFVSMQQKMLGLNTQQRNIMREYEDELDAMKSEIKKIRVDYDGLKQKNSRYRTQLKEKSEQLKRLSEEQARAARRQQTTQPEDTWSIEKTKLLAKIKQLEIERKQAEERCKELLATKDENSSLKRELESLKFRESLWKEEKEMAERKRRKINEHKDNTIMRYADSVQKTHKQPMSMDWSSSNTAFTFDDALHKMTRSDAPYKSIPAIHILNYTESNDLQDIRKSLNEAREELMLAKSDSQVKKDQFLAELKEREELQKTVRGLKDQSESDTAQVREKITSMESKIASLESNCLTEVQNLVHNVDILKQELINSQRELESLKEYSRHMEKKREEEKMQILNESRELKLDLSSLRTEIRDKSQGSDRTDQSRGPLTDTRERTSPLEVFEQQYSPLVGFVGSRCDYLKIKLETLKKHLHNLDCQTQTVLSQSLGEAGDVAGTPTPNSEPKAKHIARQRSSSGSSSASSGKKRVNSSTASGSISSASGHHQHAGSKKHSTTVGGNKNSRPDCALVAAIAQQSTTLNDDDDDDDDDNNADNTNDGQKRNDEEDDDDEILVLTPRPHRNKYDKDLDTLIVENGQNIERLRLPSLEEEEDEEGEGEEDRDGGCLSQRDSARELRHDDDDVFGERAGGQQDFVRDVRHARTRPDARESPRHRRDRSLPRVEEEDETVIHSFLTREKRRATSLERQVDSRFEKLEQELENRRRKGAMPAYHHLMPKSAH